MEWFGIVVKRTATTLRMTVETYVHTKGNIKMLEVSSAYRVINTLNILCSLNDIKLSLNVRPRGPIKVGHVVLNVIPHQFLAH